MCVMALFCGGNSIYCGVIVCVMALFYGGNSMYCGGDCVCYGTVLCG